MPRRLRSWRFVAGLVVLLVALPVTGLTCLPLSGGILARAQGVTGVSICGFCSCGTPAENAQCRADAQAEYERNNPPRGQMEGVCVASYYKSDVDPQTRMRTQVHSSAIYSRFRYVETKVDGFREVGDAWSRFLKESGAWSKPEGPDWNPTSTCLVLNGTGQRTARDPQNWERLQNQAAYRRVFMPTFGIADTPEERALEAKMRKERDARLAEEKRIADAKEAEQARIRAAAAAEKKRKVDAIATQIGPGKSAAAERLAKMNEEVAKLRPKVPGARPSPVPTPSPSASAGRQCTRRQGTQPVSNSADSQDKARAGIARARATPGGSETIVASSVGAATCSQQNKLALKPPPVGNCLSCISEKLAINIYGYVPGKGYPPPKTEWVCKAVVTYTAERCGTGASKVSGQ